MRKNIGNFILCTAMTTLETILDFVEKVHAATGSFEYVFAKKNQELVDEITNELTTRKILDWTLYEDGDGLLVEGSKEAYLPLREGAVVVARKPDRTLVYVLAPSKAELERAVVRYGHYAWAKPILIPTTFYLESVMYDYILMRRKSEWEHADYVGTLSHNAIEKLQSVDAIQDILENGKKDDGDVIAFMYRGDPLLGTAERWHPGFLHIWAGALRFQGFQPEHILSEDIPSFYANYWAARPSIMKEYIGFFKKMKISLDVLPNVSELVWNDSGYGCREGVAKLDEDRCMEIWGVPWYPFHPFVFERLPCFFFWVCRRKLVVAKL